MFSYEEYQARLALAHVEAIQEYCEKHVVDFDVCTEKCFFFQNGKCVFRNGSPAEWNIKK